MSAPQRPPLRIADVSAEAILLAGGARAILLQLANPGVGHGVAAHSDFANRPLDRLHGTLTYLYVIVYGTPDEVLRVARRVGAAHAPVRSEPGEAVQYSARDDQLQLWVAATLYDTAMRVRELVYGPIAAADAESLLADYAVIATTLGLPRALWPESPATFARYWGTAEAALRVDDVARGVAGELLHPSTGPWWMRAAMPALRLFTAGLLSPRLREAYGLPFDQRRFDRLVRLIRVVYPLLPRWIRHAPKRRYLARFRTGSLPG
ncbi:MAG: oxygenase MpaB family protein [Rhodoglobus sp.]